MSMRKPIRHHLADYFFPHERNNHRPHIFSIASVAVLAIAVVVFEAGYIAQTKFVFLQTDYLASVLPGALVALTNQDRAMIGLIGVTEDSLLDKAAQAAAEDMATKGYFAHVSPEGKDPWYWLNQVGYDYSYAGENLAVNFSDSREVETAWMASPTHRANIEKSQYTKVGFGTANGMYEGRDTTFVVSFFATPAIVAPVAVAEVKPSQIHAAPAAGAAPTAHVAVGPQQKQVASPEARLPQTEKVLGSQTVSFTSPSTTLETILTILFSIIAISFIASIFIRGKRQHPHVIVGAAFLFTLIAVVLFLNLILAGPVTVL